MEVKGIGPEKKKRKKKAHIVPAHWQELKKINGEVIWKFRKDYKGFHLNKTGTEEECQEFAIARMREIDLGITEAKKPIFKNRWEAFIRSLHKKDEAKQRTVQEYDDTIIRYVYPEFKNADIRQMTHSVLDDFFIDFAKKAPSSAYNTLSLLRRFFWVAVADRVVLTNPTKGISINKKVVKKPRTVDAARRDEIKKILAAMEGDHFYLFFVMAYVFGLRRGELLGIKLADIYQDAEGKTRIKIERQIVRANDDAKKENFVGWDFDLLKSSRPPFEIILPDELLPILEKHKEIIAKRLEKRENKFGMLFPSRTGLPYYPSSVDAHLRKVIKNNNLPKTYIHEFRKFSASETSQADGTAKDNDELVTQQLNHSTNAVNHRYVAPPDPKKLQPVFEQNFANLFAKKDENRTDEKTEKSPEN